ncbi:MAG: hypothetical protein HWN68_20400 [Desulfobacterales bacterium]|nr:hypothetical protein [Desulfobacterales bacterium]
MPIRWSALKVSEAADRIEEFVKQAAEPLEQARIVAREARNLANLPQYIDQDFSRIISEIDRAIGDSQFEPIGRIRGGIESVRKDIPDGAIEAERESAKHGITNSLV